MKDKKKKKKDEEENKGVEIWTQGQFQIGLAEDNVTRMRTFAGIGTFEKDMTIE